MVIYTTYVCIENFTFKNAEEIKETKTMCQEYDIMGGYNCE
jgi:hypothetical protein